MAIDNKPLDLIDESDLQSMIGIPESKVVEYKKAIFGNGHEEVREFLSDVSSFANAGGGHLVFGIREEEGVAVEVCGLQDINADDEKGRIENILRDNIEPRIPSIGIQVVPLEASGVAVVMRIPRSWSLPHVVNYQKHWKFYSRHSAGKYPLDVGEVRTAFSLSETTAERIRNFRAERLSLVVSGQTPAPLDEGAKVVLHIVPLGAFSTAERVDVASLDLTSLEPMRAGGWSDRYNLDGRLSWQSTATYLQVFRNGSIEAVSTDLVIEREDRRVIPSLSYERELVGALPRFLGIQKSLGVEPPFFIMLSLLGVSGCTMGLDPRLEGPTRYPIDQDALLLPEVLTDSFECVPSEVMRPAFDAVWNAAGHARSLNYSEEGEWGAGPNSRPL